MMRKSKRQYSPSAIEQAAQRNWNEAWGYHRDQSRRWFILGTAALVVSGVAVGSACWLAGQSKVVPYVVDRNGPSVQVAQLQANMPDASRIKGHLTTWVQGFRTVSSDAANQKRMIDQTYAWTDNASIGQQQLNDWYLLHKPAERAKTETVDVDVQSVIPQGGDVWLVDWSETAWSREPGHLPQTTLWRMTVNVQVRIPQTDEQIKANWDGVFTKSFHVQGIGN